MQPQYERDSTQVSCLCGPITLSMTTRYTKARLAYSSSRYLNVSYRIKGPRTMKTLKQIVSDVWMDESGQDLIEYALVACLIALSVFPAMTSLATNISFRVQSPIGSKLTAAV